MQCAIRIVDGAATIYPTGNSLPPFDLAAMQAMQGKHYRADVLECFALTLALIRRYGCAVTL